MNSHPVFFDPEGRRKKVVSRWVILAVCVSVMLGAVFTVSVFNSPALPTSSVSGIEHKRFLPSNEKKQDAKALLLLASDRKKLIAEIDKDRSTTAELRPRGEPIVAGYYSPAQETGIHSLNANVDRMTHLLPAWLHLKADARGIDWSDFDVNLTPKNAGVIETARKNGLRIIPILDNGPTFEKTRVRKLLADKQAQYDLAALLKYWLEYNNFQGIHIDFEDLDDVDYARLPGFFKILKDTFRPGGATTGLGVTCALEAGNNDVPLKQIGEVCDWVVFMAYDEHAAGNPAGPISGLEWSQQQIDIARKVIPPSKLILGIGSYAYDWTDGSNIPEDNTYQQAITTAAGYRDQDKPEDVIDVDETSVNPHFEYTDDDDKHHNVWMLDGLTAYNNWKIARQDGFRGAALWVLGSEDPSIWNFFDRHKVARIPAATSLQSILYPYDVDFRGKGEILTVASQPAPGQRQLEIDPASGLITDETYSAYPSPLIIQRSGYQPKTIALTFDDGPDPKYTPLILDKLKQLGVPATFFLIGQSAERNPKLVRRIFDEGHEIGSHSFSHPNLGLVNPERAVLELNTTQRAFQAILGRSTLLFRPPYNADAEPTTKSEVAPIELASSMGYLTIGELIDPQDWLLEEPGPNGDLRQRTPEEMANEVLQEVPKGEGNTLLLHDGGGDRSRTLKVLDIIVPKLRAEGYEFVPVSTLAKRTRDQVMPKLSQHDLILVGLDRLVFDTVFNGDAALAFVFVIAIALGFARQGLVIPLALAHSYRRKGATFAPFEGTVGVLIAAYNEEKVIVRTIESILASTYPLHEVVVVDDGSKDGTGEGVLNAFAESTLVRVVQQENGGKAEALNHALRESTSDVVVCVDADTQLDPNAIGLLVRHFGDEEIAAVAGNVRVGNVHNLFTRWQWIEYTTSQNLDRRAYALLNSITVVPGAIGAWRRTAVLEAGGYVSDTLAEDMDLTWRLRESGYRLETESDALAFTEAPETLQPFFKQRFRWAYGTLQCLWKHRRSLGRYGFFGRVALPALWLFQIVFQALAPLIDLQMLVSLGSFLVTWYGHIYHPSEYDNYGEGLANLQQVASLYVLFFLAEMGSALIAFKMEGLRPKSLWSLLIQRFFYRQLMYAVMFKSFATAAAGARQGWGKLERKASVRMG